LENLLPLAAGVLGIVVIDLVLSGDNALVIGMAARRLPPTQRRLAIILGGGAAIALRVLFATIAAFLLTVPLLEATGGLILLWVAWKLLQDSGPAHETRESLSIFGALKTIVVADVVMSLDNILAIAGVSHGDIGLLLFGLLLSMPLILFGSGLISALLNRLPWLGLLGSAILAWTAGAMVIEDQIVSGLLPDRELLRSIVPPLLAVAMVLPSVVGMVRTRKTAGKLGSEATRERDISAPEHAETEVEHRRDRAA